MERGTKLPIQQTGGEPTRLTLKCSSPPLSTKYYESGNEIEYLKYRVIFIYYGWLEPPGCDPLCYAYGFWIKYKL